MATSLQQPVVTGRETERAAAETLSEALGDLPLAHEQAAAYCERLTIMLAEYHKRFEAAPGRLLDTDKDAPSEYHDGRTVAKTFALAIEEASKLHPGAEPLFAGAGADPAVSAGRGRSLSGCWRSMRRCSAPRTSIRPRASTTSPICLRTKAILRARGRSMSARWQSKHPNTNRARRNFVSLLRASSNPGEALICGEAALAAHEKLLGQDHLWTKDSARVTADALAALGRADEAEALRAGCQIEGGTI